MHWFFFFTASSRRDLALLPEVCGEGGGETGPAEVLPQYAGMPLVAHQRDAGDGPLRDPGCASRKQETWCLWLTGVLLA